jgi:hypothetical protein
MKKLLVCLLAGALLSGTTLTAEAANQITFGKGKSSASVSGKVQGSDAVDYVLRASAGQTLTVDFKASKATAYFNVFALGSTGEAMFNGSSEGQHFKAALPSDGDYTIRVYLMGGAKDDNKLVTYTLKVGIPVATKTGSAVKNDGGLEAAKKACLAAVAKKVGVSASKLKVIDTQGSQAGIGVNIQVPDATAPWTCLSDKKGHVQGASFTGSEGDM